MRLKHGLHLAYCTNIHPGEDWTQAFDSLNRYTLGVRRNFASEKPFAIGLRLSNQASLELSEPIKLLEFQRWLDRHNCYVFTINGFPFGRFHDTRVKERVYLPDWTEPSRLEYTNRLFDLLARLVPPDIEGSVSTSPGSFKEFIKSPQQERMIRDNVWRCVENIAGLSERSGRKLHLGLEPEPLGLFENSAETAVFFDRLRDEHPGDARLGEHLGVNYDACHFAVEFEEPADAIATLQRHGIRLSKLHLSNALKLHPTAETRTHLANFADDVYLHQVVCRDASGALTRFKDLDQALASADGEHEAGAEWRVHFHVPLHCQPVRGFSTTADHITGLLELLEAQPGICSHMEMETYTWAVLPEPLKVRDVCEQIVAEYQWTLTRFAEHGLAP
jgi:hypothetical protein